MAPDQALDIGGETILQRTNLGARALVFGHLELDRAEKQLLGVVTGFTPLDGLERLGIDSHRARTAATGLIARGLLSRTQH